MFYLGAHMPSWLTDTPYPLFVSHRRLVDRHPRTLPRARCRWVLDSGAFTEVAQHHRFTTTPAEYVAAIRRYHDDVGLLEWAAPQDHMCESWVLARSEIANTVAAAQQWTIDNYLTLSALDSPVPIVPVLQGQTVGDYVVHAAMYAAAGIDLEAEPLVGVGSVCRRQATTEITEIIAVLSQSHRLHGFGVKTTGIARYGSMLTSADSMAWSYRGRRIRPCPRHGLTSCANCRHHADEWRANALRYRGHDATPTPPSTGCMTIGCGA
jgi:hypothetical protein